MRFIVDSQLPPALAHWLSARGHDAHHVRDLGLDAKPDTAIVAEAIKPSAAILTKDSDFKQLATRQPGLQVVWLRFGNASSADLLATLEPLFAQVEQAIGEGQTLVEIR